MKYLLMLFALINMIVLTACGGESTTPTPVTTSNDPAGDSTAPVGFRATVSGAESSEITGSGYFQCEPEDGLVIAPAFTFTNTVLITIPETATPGTYELTTDEAFNNDAYTAMFIGEEMEQLHVYEDNVSGSITLEAIAGDPGETVRGNFEFTASNNSGESVTVNGDFDFVASSISFFNCREGDTES